MTNQQAPHDDDAALLHESADDLYNNAPCGYLSTTPEGTIARVNHTLLTWTGYRRDELVGRLRFADLLRVGGKLFYETHVVPLLQLHGEAQELAFDLLTKDGRLLPTLVSITQTRHASGQPLLLRMTVFNASDRRRYEQELLRAKSAAEQAALELRITQAAVVAERDRLRQILNVLPVAVLIVDVQGQPVLTNAAADALLGHDLTATPLEGAACPPGHAALLLHADSTPYTPPELPLRRSLDSSEVVPATEALVRQAHGARVVPVLVSSTPLRADDGTVTGAITVLQDISPLKDLERAREEFLGAAAHDLKGPLTGAQGLAQLAQRRLIRLALPQTQPIIDHLRGIETAMRRLTTLIDDLVDITRLQLGALLNLDRRPTDLIALAHDTIKQQHGALGDRVVLQADLAELVVTVDGDRIERVLANLIGNAVKYSRPDGQIVVRVAQQGDGDIAWAVLIVQDTGVGIPAADLPHIFERYYRAGNVRGHIQGTGIGLASVRQIVEQHGGTVEVQSREGHGTTVTVRLPCLPP